MRSPTPGPRVFVELRYEDTSGAPIAGIEVDVWHASTVGLYESQDADQADMNLRGKFTTDADGCIRFVSIKPAGYPIPTDGLVGKLLSAQGRHPFRPAHLHALARKQGYKTLISQIYSADDPRLDDDVQFGVTASLIGHYRRPRRTASRRQLDRAALVYPRTQVDHGTWEVAIAPAADQVARSVGHPAPAPRVPGDSEFGRRALRRDVAGAARAWALVAAQAACVVAGRQSPREGSTRSSPSSPSAA